MSKKIGILAEFNYEDLELWYPYYRLKEEGHETFTIGPEKNKTYNSKHGYPCKAEFGIDEISVDGLDALIIPGGFSPDYLRRDKRILALVKAMDDAGKVLASICHGAWVLISAKVIKGRNVTCFIAIKDDVENAGANYTDVSVVVDKNMVTSRLPKDLPDFCKAIISKLR
ncbi:putative cysteine protease YraA [Ruditapes philippinarum]|jgi:protease I|uniref:putative cysteine protease YraA n=1 Tax=Ruditapes philippinarum TaxID=129788 RepID=UPI00295AE8D1|nr:putative cysteine protease YraA [Ruditapes philippinarum]